jgi:hypothetical protein
MEYKQTLVKVEAQVKQQEEYIAMLEAQMGLQKRAKIPTEGVPSQGNNAGGEGKEVTSDNGNASLEREGSVSSGDDEAAGKDGGGSDGVAEGAASKPISFWYEETLRLKDQVQLLVEAKDALESKVRYCVRARRVIKSEVSD